MRFESEDEMASFVRWADNVDVSLPQCVRREVIVCRSALRGAGWTTHGHFDEEWCPPGKIYVYGKGTLDRTDPAAIAGYWSCTCGAEFTRLAYLQDHLSSARSGSRMNRPGPHELLVARVDGPRHLEYV